MLYSISEKNRNSIDRIQKSKIIFADYPEIIEIIKEIGYSKSFELFVSSLNNDIINGLNTPFNEDEIIKEIQIGYSKLKNLKIQLNNLEINKHIEQKEKIDIDIEEFLKDI